MGSDSIFISIVIPTYNEESRIDESLDKIMKYMENQGHRYEIILVDDGSCDNTVDVVKIFSAGNKNMRLIQNERNRGKGYSIRKGVLDAKGGYILFSDADLSTPIEEIEKLLKYLEEGYEVTIGSRDLPDSDIRLRQPFYREFSGKIFNRIARSITLLGIRDTQCGFKCFKKDAAKTIFSRQRLDGFSFDVETLYIAKKRGYKIKEVPVVWINSNPSSVSLGRDSIQMLIDLLKIRMNECMGRYS
ncbi:MAG: dolichyl-phosphate beta-glucosyltransferase [Candidatus Altiarchaeota archaeon]|nr:dolichyl-phosphate beta-glucosyltransferase [Candidatus Altiarchaeota archaeon]